MGDDDDDDEDDDRERVTTTKDANPMWTAAPWVGVSATTTTTKRRAVSGHDDERIMMMTMRGKPTPRTGASRLGAVKEGETTTGDCTTTSSTTWGLPPRTRTSTVINDDDAAAGLANAKGTLSTEARSWKECFDRAEDVRIDGDGEITKGGVFRVYSSNFASSSGASGASDASDASPVLLACLHGCPYTGLTWGPCAEELARRARSTSSLSSPSPASSMEIFAMDLRGHGESVANAPDAAACESFDPDVMAEDALETLRVFVARRGEEEKTKKTRRKVVVVGHSMGGAIAARLAKRLEELDAAGDGFVEVVGLILIDIVEGSAMAALPAMGALVDARPETFESLEEAMTWSMTKGGGTRNPRSAAISLPSQLRELRVAGGADTSSASRRYRFAWRTNLRATAKYWSDWYTGLSKLYLSVKAPKLLLLAGNDRLDTELTIAQMQGKFQMTLLPKAGHAIQEDDPDSVATVLENFVGRYVLNPRPTPPSFFDADANAKAPPG